MKRMSKPAIVLLSICLLVAPVGCRSGADRAMECRSVVEVGMSHDEVAGRLGEPDGWEENVGGFEVWIYAYRPSLGHFIVWRSLDAAILITEIAVTAGLVLAIAWLLRGNLPSGFGRGDNEAPPSPASGRYQRYSFRVGFDRETGRVAFVSNPWPE